MRHVPRVGASDRSVLIRAWLAVALWVGVIALLSGDDFSAAHTRDWLRRFVRFFFPDTPGSVLFTLHKTLRKGAHVAAYGVLALLSLRALRVSFAAGFRRHALASLLLVASVAVADELHQSRSAARTGSRGDVALDLAGGGAALLGLSLARAARRSPREA
jgi:VanZ family protein